MGRHASTTDVKAILEDNVRFIQTGILAPSPEGFAPEVNEILHGGRAKLNVTPMLGNFDGPDHRRLRQAIHRSFTPAPREAARARHPRHHRRVSRRRCSGLGEADVIEALTYRVPIRAVFLLSGFPAGHMDQLKKWSDDLAALIASPLPLERQIECARSYRAFEDYVHAAIDDCRANPRDDFMSDLIRSVDAGEVVMDEAELLMLFTINLLLAGHETTTYAMTGMLYHLLAEPSRWKRVVEDPAAIPATVEEALRFEPPMLGFWRYVAADTSFGGVEMKAGDRVYWLNTSANHDDAAFERADEFDVDAQRTQPALTFGFGAALLPGSAAREARARAPARTASGADAEPRARSEPGRSRTSRTRLPPHQGAARDLVAQSRGRMGDRLKGKVALVTGGARGQGEAEARCFVARARASSSRTC